MAEKTWKDEYQTQIDDCEKRESMLTDWERQFIDSLSKQIDRNNRPSPKQIDCLDSIWEKATSRG